VFAASWHVHPHPAAAQELAQANGDGDAAAGGDPAAAEGEEAQAAASAAAEPAPAAKPVPSAAAGQQARAPRAQKSLPARRTRCEWLQVACGPGLYACHRAPKRSRHNVSRLQHRFSTSCAAPRPARRVFFVSWRCCCAFFL